VVRVCGISSVRRRRPRRRCWSAATSPRRDPAELASSTKHRIKSWGRGVSRAGLTGWVRCAAQVVVGCVVEIGVADPTVLDLDQHVVGADCTAPQAHGLKIAPCVWQRHGTGTDEIFGSRKKQKWIMSARCGIIPPPQHTHTHQPPLDWRTVSVPSAEGGSGAAVPHRIYDHQSRLFASWMASRCRIRHRGTSELRTAQAALNGAPPAFFRQSARPTCNTIARVFLK
jgi:hypothetical protein